MDIQIIIIQSAKSNNRSLNKVFGVGRIGGAICGALRRMSRHLLDLPGLPDIRTTSLKGMFRKQLF